MIRFSRRFRNAPSHTSVRSHRARTRVYLEELERRIVPTLTLAPEPANAVAGLAGNLVEFRKGPAGFISPADTLASADNLFALALSDANVIADATDNGVAVINYVDTGGGNVFSLPRDVGIPPLTAIKTTGAADGVNAGTFNPLAEDDEFAMRASGFIFIPTAGNWTFSVRSDDGERLLMGTDNQVVTIFDGSRTPATDSTTVVVPRSGFYRYQLTWDHGISGAMAEFFAQGPSDPSPQLVGDTANGGLAVFQTVNFPPVVTGSAISAVEGDPFSATVATFTEADPTVTAMDFSAVVNYGDGTAPVTITSTASANGQIIADTSVPGQFDVVGNHTFAEEGHFTVSVTVTDLRTDLSGTTASFDQSNLVTDNQSVLTGLGYQAAAHVDTNLVNPWGLAAGPGGPSWVADNGTGVSTLYDGNGVAQGLVVTIPASSNPGATSPASVTGIVFNSTTDFDVAGPGTPAVFIFATEDGTIAAWNSGTSALLKVDNANFSTGPVYKGLAIGNNGSGNFLYATNFRQGTIDVFDTNFNQVTLAGNFTDPNLPAGFAPFGIQLINGELFVTYAVQDASKHDDVAGPGNGIVDIFDLNGNLIKRLVTSGALNSPWGLALAPSTFGLFANDLLVGNFGDGTIHAYDPNTGNLLGQLRDASGAPIAIDGLWSLRFGNNGTAGPASTLFFTAGINGEQDGLFGSLTAENSGSAVVADAPLVPGDVSSGSATGFSGVGGTNVSGGALNALDAFKAAVGGVNNGATPTPQTGGFRVITWDGVKLDGTDFGGDTTVIDPNHVVGIPINRFQNVGVDFEQVYAVSGPASASDSSTFTTVNPSVDNLFPAFSPKNTFAMFNDNTIDLSFALASGPNTTPVAAASRGFGAIFVNVELPNSTSIEYFNGNTSLGKFFVPVGGAGQAEFLGELFDNPIVTRVTLTLGTEVLFSFDGVHFAAGPQPNDPSHGHNLVVTDDFVFAEPVRLANSITTGRQFSGQVATFSDLDPSGVVTDYTATINWGDGHQSVGTITPDGHGGFAVSGSNTFAHAGQFDATINVQDFGGSIVLLRTLIQVPPVGFAAGADQGSTSMVHVYDSSGNQIGSFLAFDPSFTGGVRVAVGDVNGDGILDIMAASGPGQDPLVKVIDGTKLGDLQQNGEIADNALLAKFDAYNPQFLGGVNVAFGRDALARPELVTGAGAGGGPHVLVLDATKLDQVQGNGEIAPSAVIAGFYAYSPDFNGGVTVAIGDVNGDGTLDIITGAGPGGGPHVKVVDGTKLTQLANDSEPTGLLGSFYAYDPAFTGGVYVAFGRGSNGVPELITGAGPGGGPHVKVIDATKLDQLTNSAVIADSALLGQFYGYSPDFNGGVRVGAADINGDGIVDIFLAPGPAAGQAPQTVKVVDGNQLTNLQNNAEIADAALLDNLFAFGAGFSEGVFIGAA